MTEHQLIVVCVSVIILTGMCLLTYLARKGDLDL